MQNLVTLTWTILDKLDLKSSETAFSAFWGEDFRLEVASDVISSVVVDPGEYGYPCQNWWFYLEIFEPLTLWWTMNDDDERWCRRMHHIRQNTIRRSAKKQSEAIESFSQLSTFLNKSGGDQEIATWRRLTDYPYITICILPEVVVDGAGHVHPMTT